MINCNERLGSSMDDFLQDKGVLEEASTIALKDAVAWRVQEAVEEETVAKQGWQNVCIQVKQH